MHTPILIALMSALGAAEAAPSTPSSPPMVEAPAVAEATSKPAAPAPAAAPADNLAHQIILNDDQVLRGRIVSETPDVVVLELLSGGRLELSRASIWKIETIEVSVSHTGETWFKDPNRTRYLYAPSAMMLKPGECYFSQKELFFSAIGCGVHENVSVLFGTVLPAWFAVPTSGYGMNAIAALKLGTSVTDTFHVAGGFETILLPYGGGVYGGGFVFGSATVGGSNAHLTISAGRPFLFSGSGSGMVGDLLFVAAGNYRLAPNFALVTENWIMPYLSQVSGSRISMYNGVAVRFIDPHWTADVGLVRMDSTAIPVPWLDIAYNF